MAGNLQKLNYLGIVLPFFMHMSPDSQHNRSVIIVVHLAESRLVFAMPSSCEDETEPGLIVLQLTCSSSGSPPGMRILSSGPRKLGDHLFRILLAYAFGFSKYCLEP